MNLNNFDYPLPKELIAQRPLSRRDASRLLVIDRLSGHLSDRFFSDIVDYMRQGDVLVLNDTKVFPARIVGKKKKTGGKVDVLLLNPYVKPALSGADTHMSATEHRRIRPKALWTDSPELCGESAAEAEELATKKVWKCLVQPALRKGQEIIFGYDHAEGVFLKRDIDGIPLVEFKNVDDVKELAHQIGTMPLPPYVEREADQTDQETYQTIFAEKEGAVAAPTAGLHFTRELLDKLRDKGVEILMVTLHVGYGTFKSVEDLETHQMHSEVFELSATVVDKINQAKAQKRKIWCVGTTAMRVLETCVQDKKLIAGKGETDLFIKEPFEFEAVDHLVTNFHLPKTTLLLLVSAFMGEKLRKKSYEHAIEKKYRFYSYGDAMLII